MAVFVCRSRLVTLDTKSTDTVPKVATELHINSSSQYVLATVNLGTRSVQLPPHASGFRVVSLQSDCSPYNAREPQTAV